MDVRGTEVGVQSNIYLPDLSIYVSHSSFFDKLAKQDLILAGNAFGRWTRWLGYKEVISLLVTIRHIISINVSSEKPE